MRFTLRTPQQHAVVERYRSGACVGCREADGIIRVPELARVCESCHEVLPLVFEVELERVREATAKLRALLDAWEAE